jgi:uncharacterized protein (DUF1499 family)
MSKTLSVLVILLALVAVVFALLGWWSARMAPSAGGVNDGRLAQCPSEPHCVCSDAGPHHDTEHWIEPIVLPQLADEIRWRVLGEVIVASGGKVMRQDANYLHATYSSALFRFVDDLELRLDGAQLQLRSTSRVGYSDLGANRKRVEDLRLRVAAAFKEVKP